MSFVSNNPIVNYVFGKYNYSSDLQEYNYIQSPLSSPQCQSSPYNNLYGNNRCSLPLLSLSIRAFGLGISGVIPLALDFNKKWSIVNTAFCSANLFYSVYLNFHALYWRQEDPKHVLCWRMFDLAVSTGFLAAAILMLTNS